jgi:thioredoxin-related protein
MKKIQIFLIALLFAPAFSIQAQNNQSIKVKWYTIEEAEKLSKQHSKKVMIDVYTDWCGWCKKMDKETFNHPVIAQYINENYYPVKLNAESKEDITFMGTTYRYVAQGARGYHELAAGLLNGQLSFPSVAYLNEKLELLGAIPGYKTPEVMEPLLVYISEDKFMTQSLVEFQKTFKGKIAPTTTVDQ